MEHDEHDKKAEEEIKRIIGEYGWYVAMFKEEPPLPAFAYTIGLWDNYGHPEIISFGLDLDVLGSIINDAGAKVKDGQPIELDIDQDDHLESFPVRFRSVAPENIRDHFGYARWYHQYKEFKAVQLFWPDKNGYFPWQNEYDHALKFNQPLLDRVLDFKFFEERNVACFALRQIFKEGKPILFVSHDEEDGAWQFLTGEPAELKDLMVVALEQVVKLDPTINDLFNLSLGESATRKFIGDKWVRELIAKS